MRTSRSLLLATCAGLALTPAFGPVLAQQADATSEEDGKSFLTRTIENALSSDGMKVDITGFTGALSSQATMARLTISDENGVWLDMENAVLDWNRGALLRGRLDVNELSAESITLTRLPEGEQKQATPEASGVSIPSIPDLPVAVQIGALKIGTFDLGEAVVGQAASLSLDGSASLASGALDTDLAINRLDQPGKIAIAVKYDPESENLGLDITAQEAQGGLVSSLMGLPGTPSVDLSIAGTGPLDAYDAKLKLDTDGQQRLAGDVSIRGRDDGGREFTADLGGDLTALMAPDYRDFLGEDIGLTATGTYAADGALDLQLFRLRSASVNLEGRVALDAAHSPQSFDLKGLLASPSGADRLDLPFGDGLSLASGKISAAFDRSKSNDVTAHVEALSAAMPGFGADALTLDVNGPLKQGGESKLTLALAATGLSADDPAVAQALGQTLTGSADVTFGTGPIAIENLKLAGPALTLTGAARYGGLETTTEGEGEDQEETSQAAFTLEAAASVADLAAFSSLSGLDLAGQAELSVKADMQLPAGTGQITATGTGENLKTGIAQADALLATPAKLDLDVTRDETGITLNTLALGTDQMKLTGGGRLGSDDGKITYDLALSDANLLTGAAGDPAPFDLSGAITQTAEAMTITAKGGGDRLALGVDAVDGLLATGLDVDALVTLPKDGAIRIDRADISNDALRLSASGPLKGKDSEMAIDLSAWLANSATFTGGSAGPLSLTGQVTSAGEAIRATLSGGGDDIGTGIAAVDALLDGPTAIDADVTLEGSKITVTRAVVDAAGVDVNASGTVDDDATALDLALSLPNSAAALGASAGPLALTAKVTGENGGYRIAADGKGTDIGIGNAQIDALFAGDTTLSALVTLASSGLITVETAQLASTALDASASGTVDGSAITMDVSAGLDNVARLAEGFNGPLKITGKVSPGADGALQVSAQASGPSGSDATVSGLVAKPDGTMTLAVKGSAPLGLANPFLAPRSVSGLASFDLSVDGQPALSSVSGQVSLSGGRLIAPSYSQVIEDIGGTVQLSGGRAVLNISASPSEGGQIRITGPLALEAPYRAGLDIAIDKVILTQSGLLTTTLDGNLAVEGPLTGGGTISGRIGMRDTEVRVPSGGFGGQEAIPEMTHLNEPAASYATRARAGLTGTDSGSSVVSSGSGGSSGGLGLDVRIVTDESVFIRGRGLDAELRGDLTIGGTTSDPRPVGQFDLERGRLSILTKRLDLSEGQLIFAGGFEPILHFVAASQSSSYTYEIGIDGTTSAPEISFSSSPSLPEDEILSQLFFEKPLSELSAIQAAQLAAAVATLTGSGGGGVLGSLREKTGLDNLDVATDAEGEASVTAGKYINENLYTETEVTSAGETTLSINLDLTDNIRAKGSVDTTGSTGLGVFFEKDY